MTNPQLTLEHLQKNLMYQGLVMVEMEVTWPAVKGSLGFNWYYRRDTAASVRYVYRSFYPEAVKQYRQAVQDGYPFNGYVYNKKATPSYTGKQLVSLYTDTYEYAGGAHGLTTRKGDTWDLAVQLLPRKLSLGSLFQPGTPYRRIILEEIRRQALLNIAQGNDIYFEDVEKNIIQYFDPKNYYLVPEGVAVYYPLYSLAPYAAGILVFVIDYSIFGDSLVYRLPGA